VRAIEQVPRTCGSCVELRFQVRLLGAAHAGAFRAAGLRHEAVDHAVEQDAVIKPLTREFLDALDVFRREVRAQLDRHLPLRGLQQQRVFEIRHPVTPSFLSVM
jgi:hypothetical protein